MIVRITFVGIVKNSAGKKKGYRDYIDIHTASIEDAKKMWDRWQNNLDRGYMLIGGGGVYHPVGQHGEHGEVKAESFEERKKED